jgi:hypothetical protein
LHYAGDVHAAALKKALSEKGSWVRHIFLNQWAIVWIPGSGKHPFRALFSVAPSRGINDQRETPSNLPSLI